MDYNILVMEIFKKIVNNVFVIVVQFFFNCLLMKKLCTATIVLCEYVCHVRSIKTAISIEGEVFKTDDAELSSLY